MDYRDREGRVGATCSTIFVMLRLKVIFNERFRWSRRSGAGAAEETREGYTGWLIRKVKDGTTLNASVYKMT